MGTFSSHFIHMTWSPRSWQSPSSSSWLWPWGWISKGPCCCSGAPASLMTVTQSRDNGKITVASGQMAIDIHKQHSRLLYVVVSFRWSLIHWSLYCAEDILHIQVQSMCFFPVELSFACAVWVAAATAILSGNGLKFRSASGWCSCNSLHHKSQWSCRTEWTNIQVIGVFYKNSSLCAQQKSFILAIWQSPIDMLECYSDPSQSTLSPQKCVV